MRKIYYFFPASIFAFVYFGHAMLAVAEGSVIINEIQLGPTGSRFIELYNPGSSSVDLSDWYIQRKTQTGSSFGSLVTKTDLSGKSISAHGYFVISRSDLGNSDVILGDLTITDSNTIQIKNSAGAVVDKVGWGEANDCSGACAPNPPDEKSINKMGNGSWSFCVPSPGSAYTSCGDENNDDPNNDTNTSTNINTGTNTNTSSGISTPPIQTTLQKKTEIPKIKVQILSKPIYFSDLDVVFESKPIGLQGEALYRGKVFWNFGDGDSKEQINDFTKFTHTYPYPGEYQVSVEYYQNYYSEIPDAVNQMTIKIVSADVIISAVGSEKDPFVELLNNTEYDVDISKWTLYSKYKSFVFPKKSVILAKNKTIISSRVTKFDHNDVERLSLYHPGGELAFEYPPANSTQIQNVFFPQTSPVSIETSTQKDFAYSDTKEVEINLVESSTIPVFDPADLTASPGSLSSELKNNYVWFYVLGAGIVVASISVIMVRRAKFGNKSKEFTDIKSDDMKIME